MFAKAVANGKLNADTPARQEMQKILNKIPAANRDLSEAQLREHMHAAAKSGARKIHTLDDGDRVSVETNVTARFAPHYRDSLSMKKLEQVSRQLEAIGAENMITATLRTGNNSDGNQMNFEIALPKTEADLLVTAGVSFFPKPADQVADAYMIILPGSAEKTVNISKSDCAAIVEGTNYPGNAGKKTIMTIAGWVASEVGLVMEHFGLGRITVQDPTSKKFVNYNVKVGGASFTGKTTSLTGFVDERVFGPGESRVCYNDDMIFTDPKTGKSYSMESGQFFTCSELTKEKDAYLWTAQKHPQTIGYNLVVRNGEFDFHDPKSDPNARIAVPRGAHRAIDIERYNTTDTEHSSGRLDAAFQLFRGPHFPPGFIMNPEMAAILLAAGPTQKTAAQVGGGTAAKVNGAHIFKPLLDEAEFEAKKATLPGIERLFPPEVVSELLSRQSNAPVSVSQLINDLFVSGFIMENPQTYIAKMLELYTGSKMTLLGLNTGYAGPIVANATMHPFDGPSVRVYDFSATLGPVVSQDLFVHTLRGEIKTEHDPLLGVDVIVKAGGVDYTPILPRTLYKKAGIDYEDTVRRAYSKYADFLEQNNLADAAAKLRALGQNGNGKP